jgi:hypothetical protein
VAPAVLTILVILIGLPLLAWWIGGRRFWGRLRPGAPRDPWGDLMREYRLTGGEMASVSSAVAGGRRLDDERLRRAAVAMAQASLRVGPQWRGGSRAQRLFFLLVTVWLGLLLASVGLAVWESDLSHFPWWNILTVLAVAGSPVWQRHKARQALESNSALPRRERN